MLRDGQCPQAWPDGLKHGLLRECKYDAKHRGKHCNQLADMRWWGGKLTSDQEKWAALLREREIAD